MSVPRSPIIAVLLLQAPVVDPDSGYVSIQWLPWFRNINQAVNAGLALDGTALKMPFPAIGVPGGVQATLPEPSQWVNQIDALGVPQLSQPDFSDLSGTAGIPFVTFGVGAPGGIASESSVYFDTTSPPYAGYVYHLGAWVAFA